MLPVLIISVSRLPLFFFLGTTPNQAAIIDDTFTMQLRLGIWPLYVVLGMINGMLYGGMLTLAVTVGHVLRKWNRVSVNI